LLTSFELINFSSLYLFLPPLFFHSNVVFLLYSHLLLLTSLPILLPNKLSLFSFFLLMKQNSILNLRLLSISLCSLESNLLFSIDFSLPSHFFCLSFLHLNHCIFLFQSRDFGSSSSCFFDFLPGFHFFLL